MMEFAGRHFLLTHGSDVQRDGMYVEVSEQISGGTHVVLEVFYWDQDGRMTFSAFCEDLPLELIEFAAQAARERLTPSVVGMGAVQ
ncbi:hypothetical protein ILFOPFJJ_00367 [Ensifer psoraleae]|uniref:hypothetical protein n=1 Tax=Sinorhizobium psoraleae TaxID=520838 RepID=UPI0015685CC5|nr:hypothetical protein [Sinorhizobium psoraleae]NRP69501.1 hypothetical protein [Sinorhizobium psoraleae]